MNLTSENVVRFSVQLAGLPWHWVEASRLFVSGREIQDFACLSKDAQNPEGPVTVAYLDGQGWVTAQDALYQLDIREMTSDWYLPLGFAVDVLRWREAYGEALPQGVWEDFRDETREEKEGGSPEAFCSHFVGSMWWVVYPPETPEPPPKICICLVNTETGEEECHPLCPVHKVVIVQR